MPFSPCDQRRAYAYLDGELSAHDQRSFEDHLSDCETCRAQMEESAVDADWWNSNVGFLSTDSLDETLATLPSGEGNVSITQLSDYAESVSNDSLRRVLDLLGPSEDPNMLGRLGRYEIVGAIGMGGMAVVLKGFETTLNRYVAVKVLAPHLASSRSARERFSREARAAASVLHPNVIAIHSVAEFNGLPFLVMPYIAGGSLQDRIDRDGALDVESAVRIGMQIAAGLAAAHKQGLVHRDIKPANILLEPGLERIVITDFGLARAADDASITQTGILAGTPHYMSPEQARGDRVDHRSDLFSLGSLLFTLSAGCVPFESETSYGVLRKITDHAAPRLCAVNPESPVWFETLVSRLHKNNPDDRYRSAESVSELLSTCLASLSDSATSIPKSLLPKTKNRSRWILGITGMLLLVGLLVANAPRKPERDHAANNHMEPENAGSVVWPADGEWVTLSGRFVMEGELPEIELQEPTRDVSAYSNPIQDESLIVNAENRGIANVFVWLTKDDGTPATLYNRVGLTTPDPFHVRYDNGRLHPHAFFLKSSQTLRLGNRDPISHIVDLGGIENQKVSAGEELAVQLPVQDEPVRISCEYHPWFQCYALVKDHSLVAVSDTDGYFHIDNIPRGKWRLRFWHELVGDIEQVVDERGFVQHWNVNEVAYEDGFDLPKEQRGRIVDFDRPEFDMGEFVPDLQ